MKKSQLSWWEVAQRDGFSIVCCEHFEVNFDNAPTLIVRSEFIKTKGSRTHQLRKTALGPMSEGARIASRQVVGNRMSQKAMQATESLLGN